MATPRQTHASGGLAGYLLSTTNLTGTAAASVILPAMVLVGEDGQSFGTAANPLFVSNSGSGAAANRVQGNSAAGATDVGDPVKVGGIGQDSNLTLVTNGQRQNAWLGRNGAVMVGLMPTTLPQTATLNSFGAFTSANGNVPVGIGAVGYYYDPAGATGRVSLGDATGAFVHAPPSTVTTTQSGTIATSGATAAVTFTNTTDTEVINPSTATLWASWGTPAVNGAGSFPILPNGSYRPPSRVAGTLTLLSTAATQAYTAYRYS